MKKQEINFKSMKPDIRLLLLQLIMVAILGFYLQNQIAVCSLFFIVDMLILYHDGFLNFLKNIFFYLCINIPVLVFSTIHISVLSSIIPAFLTMLIRIYPVYLTLKMLIDHEPMNELFYILDKMHVPKALSIPLMVVYRYVPTISREFHYVNESLKMRNLGFSFNNLFHLIQTAENYMVPLLARSEKIAEELSAASLCKGLSTIRKRTCYTFVKFTISDFIYFICMILVVCGLFYLNKITIF